VRMTDSPITPMAISAALAQRAAKPGRKEA
jgi:hypothetical protein